MLVFYLLLYSNTNNKLNNSTAVRIIVILQMIRFLNSPLVDFSQSRPTISFFFRLYVNGPAGYEQNVERPNINND